MDLYRKNASQSLHDPPEVCEGSDPLPAFSYYFAVMKNKIKKLIVKNLILRQADTDTLSWGLGLRIRYLSPDFLAPPCSTATHESSIIYRFN